MQYRELSPKWKEVANKMAIQSAILSLSPEYNQDTDVQIVIALMEREELMTDYEVINIGGKEALVRK